MSLFGEKIPSWLRPPVYTVGASLLLLLAAFILDSFISTDIYAKLYLYLPLMEVNTIFTYRAGGFSVAPAGSRAHRRLRLRLWVRAGGMHRLLPARNCHQQQPSGTSRWASIYSCRRPGFRSRRSSCSALWPLSCSGLRRSSPTGCIKRREAQHESPFRPALYLLAAAFIQNFILTTGFGSSIMLRIVRRPKDIRCFPACWRASRC